MRSNGRDGSSGLGLDLAGIAMVKEAGARTTPQAVQQAEAWYLKSGLWRCKKTPTGAHHGVWEREDARYNYFRCECGALIRRSKHIGGSSGFGSSTKNQKKPWRDSMFPQRKGNGKAIIPSSQVDC